MANGAPACFDYGQPTTLAPVQLYMPGAAPRRMKTAEHPERSGGAFPATQSKDAGLLGDAPASFDSVRHTTPDSAQDAYAGIFRAACLCLDHGVSPVNERRKAVPHTMMDTGSITFLQQAQRNNWQRYLASLQPGSAVGFDVCVLTASDERQAAIYRRQLDWRREAGLLPARTRFLVIPDPAGRRIGSGGATLHALAQVADWAAVTGDGEPAPAALRLERMLIIHSGGDSKRLPHCSAIGKLFARVPRTLPDGRTSTIFDEFLISLSALSAEAPPGVLISSGDVLLIFDHLQLACRRPGVIGVAAAVPAEMGRRHGVYVAAEGGHRVRAYLHKPSAAELAHWDAISPDGAVQIDTGLAWLDAATAAKWLALAHEAVVAALCGPQTTVGLNLYGDLLLPLAGSTTYESYLTDESDGPATPAVQAARRVIWERLRGAVFSVERLQPAVFVHFGSTAEYWRMAAGDEALARL